MNKIIHRFQLTVFCNLVFLLTSIAVTAQNALKLREDTVVNKYGLLVLHSLPQLQQAVKKNPANQMMDLRKLIPSLMLDLRYATTNNFMHEKLYPAITTTWLRK